jgi:hypothetical protein
MKRHSTPVPPSLGLWNYDQRAAPRIGKGSEPELRSSPEVIEVVDRH